MVTPLVAQAVRRVKTRERTRTHTLPRPVDGSAARIAYASHVLGVLLLALAASPELPFDQPGPRVVAPGQTYEVTSAVAPGFFTSLVVWMAQGRMGIEKPSIYASRVQPSGNVDDPEGLLISQPFGRDPSVAWVPSMNAWVVAWELNGETFLRVVQLDGSFHAATAAPVNLGQGRAPSVIANSAGYFVTAEALTPKVWSVQQPATPFLSAPLSATGVRYGTPVRGFETVGTTSALQTSWVEGTSLVSAKVTTAMGLNVNTYTVHLVSPLRVDLDAVVGGTVGRAVYRVSDGGSTSVEVMRLDLSTRVVLDAGTVHTDFATMAELGDGTFALTSTQTDGRGLGWRVFTDGGFTGLGTVANGASRLSVASFSMTSSTLLLWSTSNNGVLAQPASLSLAPAGQLVQLSLSPASDRFAQVAAWNGGTVAVWQRLTSVEAQHVVWRVFPDGGHAAAFDLADTTSRLDVPSMTSFSGGVALLTNQRLRRMDSAGTWGQPITISRPLSSGTLTTDRAGRLVVLGVQFVGFEEEVWALRHEQNGTVTERLIFPVTSPKPERPRLAISRDGGAGLAVINPTQEVWGTRLSSDLVARDDGGFRISGAVSMDPFVVSDDQGGFFVVYNDSNNVLARRVFDTSVSAATTLLVGEWDVGSVIEVPGGAAVVATSRATAELVTLYLTVEPAGGLGSSVQSIVSGGSFTNGAGLAVGQDSLTWVFGRYDADAGAATTRSVVASRATGAACQWGWQCVSGLCTSGACRLAPDGGPVVDAGVDAGAGVPDAGAGVDAGSGVPDAGAGVDAGTAVDAGAAVDAGGAIDSGFIDAGAQFDAGVEDAGVVEADAGVDGGSHDAGMADAGEPDAGPRQRDAASYRAGCDCQAGAGPWLISALLVMVSARRRRRL